MTAQQQHQEQEQTPARRRALVYGDVNLNIIDGSAVWAQSTVQALQLAGFAVTLVLKARVTTTRLLDPLLGLEHVTVVRPHEDGLVTSAKNDLMSPAQASQVLAALDRADPFDVVLLRGLGATRRVVEDGWADGRSWIYLTDVPQDVRRATSDSLAVLGRVARSARLLLCQTDDLRSFLEGSVPDAAGRSVVYPPVVPEPQDAPVQDHPPLAGRPVRLVYTGKFAPWWNTLPMTELPAALAARGIEAELHMVGDKVHEDPAHPEFSGRMRTALASAPGVVSHGGVSRQEAMRLSASADLGLGWRSPDLDASLELSTKLLEFGVVGTPAVLNRTPMHETLLGADYPFFVASRDDVLDAVALAVSDPESYALAVRRCREAALDHTLGVAAGRLRGFAARVFPTSPVLAGAGGPGRRLRVGVAGHDLKFFTRVLDHLRSLDEIEVRVDEWPALASNDARSSEELAAWADVVFVEWCGPAALWYAARKRPGQRLVVRLHRFELFADWPGKLDIDAVDQVVCVSPHYARLTLERTGWPAEKVGVIPNWVDVEQLDRPKLAGSAFHLGFIGMAPARKRMDLALDVLEHLRREDPRFRLFAKTKMTWDYWWIWKSADERRHVEDLMRRIQTSPQLRGAVVFDGFGPDVAAWLRKIGWVLSTSDDESFHLSPAEGMASAAVPVVRDWPGSDSIYDPRWIEPTPEDMARRVLEVVHGGRWEQERALAQEQVRRSFDLPAVLGAFESVLVRNLAPETVRGTLAVPVE